LGGTLSGRLLIDGADTAARAMHEMASDVAIGFQNPGTQLSGVASTAYEEVAFGPMNLGIARDEVLRRTEASIDALAMRVLADPALHGLGVAEPSPVRLRRLASEAGIPAQAIELALGRPERVSDA